MPSTSTTQSTTMSYRFNRPEVTEATTKSYRFNRPEATEATTKSYRFNRPEATEATNSYRFKRPEEIHFDPNIPCELEDMCDVTEKNYPL